MSLNQKQNKKNTSIGFNENYTIENLDVFKKNLEKHLI